MKNETLDSIDSSLINTGHFLKEILDNASKKECLQAFVDCQDIIKWLRMSTKSNYCCKWLRILIESYYYCCNQHFQSGPLQYVYIYIYTYMTLCLLLIVSGVNDIQGFVTVALATAAGGEDDLASDKLSHLRNVGSGFASLIYDMSTSDGCVELMQRCTSLWDSLMKIPDLPKLLVCTCIVCIYTLLSRILWFPNCR